MKNFPEHIPHQNDADAAAAVLPYGTLECAGCGAIGYAHERYCTCCGVPFAEHCMRCGSNVSHTLSNYCARCGTALHGNLAAETANRSC